MVLLSLARKKNVSWNSVLIRKKYSAQWDEELDTWFSYVQTSTRLAFAAPACAVLTCRCLPPISPPPWIAAASHRFHPPPHPRILFHGSLVVDSSMGSGRAELDEHQQTEKHAGKIKHTLFPQTFLVITNAATSHSASCFS